MSGPFGWDYPPGCNSTPYDEAGASDISEQASLACGFPVYAYWDEDGYLWALRKSEMGPEVEIPKVGEAEWEDNHTEDENFARAALAVAGILLTNKEPA